MKAKLMDMLQNFSKAMFTPVLILPIAGILIAFGNLFTNAKLIAFLPFLNNPITKGFGQILSGSLVTILVNLGIIFCVGLAIGMAKKKKAEAGFTAMLTFLVFINAMNKFMGALDHLVKSDALRGSGQTLVLGVQILDMGVFLGIFLGVIVALIHNRFIDTEFNSSLQIYGGARFVFIVLIPITVLLAVLLTYIWPFVQLGIEGLGNFIQQSGNFGIFMYGALERLLIPTGLHHLVYTPFLYTSLGGSATVGGQVFEGARNIYLAEMVDPTVKVLSASVIWDARGISKMFGLIGACFAIYRQAKPENKKLAKAILIPAAITSMIAGVTEPIEFSFMFVAPLLFVVHSILSGLSMVVLNMLSVRAIGPNGFIDFALFNIPLGIEKTGWPLYILVGLIFFALYYFVFSFLISKLKLRTLGREADPTAMKLHNKADYQEKKTNSNSHINVHAIITGLGGAKNILTVTNCFTRLRVALINTDLVDETMLKTDTGASGVVIKGKNVQVIYGLHVTKVRTAVEQALGIVAEDE
ncbi:MAG: PTS transporter subunit EIIC [Culicoidibacterales bacterium]